MKEVCTTECLNGGICLQHDAALNTTTCQCSANFVGYRCSYRRFELDEIKAIVNPEYTPKTRCIVAGVGTGFGFDGSVFQMYGACQYEILSTIDAQLQVVIERKADCNGANCIKSLYINLSGATLIYTITGQNVTFFDADTQVTSGLRLRTRVRNELELVKTGLTVKHIKDDDKVFRYNSSI